MEAARARRTASRRLGVLGPALRDVLTADRSGRRGDGAPRPGARSAACSPPPRNGRCAAAARPRPRRAATRRAGIGATLRLAAAAPPRRVRSAPERDPHRRVRRASTGRTALDDALVRRAPDPSRLRADAARWPRQLDRRDLDPDTVSFVDSRLRTVVDALGAGRPVPILPLLGLVDSGPRLARERAAGARRRPRRRAGLRRPRRARGDGARAAPASRSRPPSTSTAPAPQIAVAFDPTVARPTIVDRVLGGVVDAVGAVDADPTAPVELTPDLDLPAWRFLRDNAPEWLLPGAGTLPDDTVVALTTNPAFVDAFLLGLNAQVVAELRFRNYPLIPGWTPVRTFWDRANAATRRRRRRHRRHRHAGRRDSTFGAAEPPDAVGVERRPRRAVQHAAVPRVPGHARLPGAGAARRATERSDWVNRPDFDARQFPAFQGRISPDRTFFGFDLDPALGAERWVVLEETVNGRRFFNAGDRAEHGDATAPTSPARRSARRGAS